MTNKEEETTFKCLVKITWQVINLHSFYSCWFNLVLNIFHDIFISTFNCNDFKNYNVMYRGCTVTRDPEAH